jgi:hypothetical protein
MKWRPAIIDGVRRDLSHLNPFKFDYIVPAKNGSPEQVYNIRVIFGLHCFTRSYDYGEAFLTGLSYGDDRETRLFDEERYKLSYRLPELIGTLGERKCYHTGHGNFVTVQIIENEQALHYSVYFKVSPSGRKGLNLYVQSAYIQDDIPQGKPQPRKPIKFMVIVHNTATNKAIREPQ